ncbi:retrovirus-related pol polyprotein from transposon TNT 1-94 [Tanacetum coccineum]
MIKSLKPQNVVTSSFLDNNEFHEIVKAKVERNSLALKAKKESSDEECSTSGSEDEENAMAVRDFKKFFKRRGRFVRQPWNDKKTFQRSRDDKNGQIYDNKCRVTFSEHDSEITKDGKVIGRGIRKKGLYVMKLGNKPKDQICLATIDENSTLWHRRLGHANMRLIQSLASKELVRNLPKLKFDQHFCDACKIGKQAHASHKAKNIVSTTRCLELLHMDLFGPSAVRSYGGNRYTLVIVDDYSRYTWTRFLKDKTEAFDQFEIFSKKIQNQLGCTIVSIRTDHGREFDNEVQFEEFCNANGITHNFSAPRTPLSNGVVERKNRTLQEMSYSQNSKAYIILKKHTRKVKESLNVTFDETPPPSKTSPLVDDDLDEEEAIKVTSTKSCTHSKLELIHMDLCGSMRVESVNGKKYILVIIDDYSSYTWVYLLRTKDETPEMIKKFVAQAHYEKLGIMKQFSIARTPQQNGVVERRNRTLMDAARTMLIFSKSPEFLWAEAISNACFKQNHSLIHTRTKKIMETIHVKFDELTAMSSEHNLSINSAAQTTPNNQDTPSSSSIIVEDNEAPPSVSSSEEQISPISNDEADKFIQEEDYENLDGNMLLSPYHTPMFKEAKSSSTV